MERLPAYWEEVFSPACLLKEPLFLRTFFQKSHTIESAQPTDSHWYYTTSLPYSFNGKEKDWESGFHYYGARYYWSETLTGWLSVDPLADKYPSISPYAYCVWNPVMLVDPDGNEALDNDDYYLNLKNGLVEYHEGSENRLDEGLVHLVGDDATYGDVEDALKNLGYSYVKNHSIPGGFIVDTEKQLKGWELWRKMPIASSFFAAEAFSCFLEGLPLFKHLGRRPASSVEIQYNWTKTAAGHMQDPNRRIPVSIIDEVKKHPMHVRPDAQGSNALMYYSTMTKNGIDYNVEVLYEQSSNTIYHFKYSKKALGPLPNIE